MSTWLMCPLISLSPPSLLPLSSLPPVLGVVPELCQCRDLELDCDGARLQDIPVVAMNVTMMWVENILLIFQYPKAPALPRKPLSCAVTVTACERWSRSQTPKHQPATVSSSHCQKMSWHWSQNEDESLMSIYVLERCTGFLTSVESFVKVSNSSLNSVEIVEKKNTFCLIQQGHVNF